MYPEQGVNVLDWLIDISTVDTRTTENEESSRARVQRLVQTWKESTWEDDEKDLDAEKAGGKPQHAQHDAVVDWNGKDSKRPGLWSQTTILLARYGYHTLHLHNVSLTSHAMAAVKRTCTVTTGSCWVRSTPFLRCLIV